MSKLHQFSTIGRAVLWLTALLGVAVGGANAQTGAPKVSPAPQTSPSSQTSEPQAKPEGKADAQVPDKSKAGVEDGDTHITPDQAKQLFSLVDELLKFSSQESGFPIKSEVKRQMTTRGAVEHYLSEKFDEDEDAKRMQRSEIVLKKFGLLDRDFNLKPFLLALLKEQIEAYYDPKTKTVNMLDWISVDEQKPVLAHELTHALQDQHLDLDKWSDQTPPDVSRTSSEDNDHLAKDELDTAREAVTEGQATAVMMDDMLKPMGESLIGNPEIVEFIKKRMSGSDNSPMLARAPLLLSESLLFPYREGLSFEQDVWMDRGQAAAFTGALDRPPSSSWEIMNPREYEQGHVPTVPYLPNIHPLVDATYRPYDIGQVGQLDLHILAGLFGGENAARDLTPAWDGGIYWAGQRLNATPAEQATTKSISLFYLSAWKNQSSAQAFVRLYADELGRKYSGLKEQKIADNASNQADGSIEQVFSTNEGPVVITRRGKLVFVSESFDVPLARKLASLILESQGSGPLQSASLKGGAGLNPGESLSAPVVRFLSNCGVTKAVVDAALKVSHSSGQVPLEQR
ncbi:hypothetical protein P8935_10375 [Telmatobacter sp. DSM 110680]|uniref:Uncharacterized protein n=1 Tax=Telmatobacter sp. DSM 110680 TaxID=3036704 RepID=A0AAU7DNJ0_9BACT